MNQRASETSVTEALPRSLYLVPNRRARNFIGREDILTKIDSSFFLDLGPHVVVLRGLGGQGKTQISLKYCRRMREEIPKHLLG
jgi:Cdc6-like AAA superfamily ATPase